MPLDEEAAVAAVDLIGRSGAKGFQVGYVRDDVPADQAGWYAFANYQGIRAQVEEKSSPVEAAEALAKLIAEGGVCLHCGNDVHLGGEEPCAWKRVGPKWVRGCVDIVQEDDRLEEYDNTEVVPLNRAEKRALQKRLAKSRKAKGRRT